MDKDIVTIIALIGLELGLTLLPVTATPHTTEKTSTHQSVHWTYEGTTGPVSWGDLSDEYLTCKTGQSQTPIDIIPATAVATTTKEFAFTYNPSPLSVVNNGHTIQVNYARGSFVRFNGMQYELAQFHFHVPSEHTINGRAWPMNVHLVHKNSAGNLLVIEVLFNEGRSNEELAKVMAYMPKSEGENKPEGVLVNASNLLPANIGYYHYQGSLTTPPCTEGVQWFVMKNPIDVGTSDVEAFKRLFPNNARPALPLNGRVVEQTI